MMSKGVAFMANAAPLVYAFIIPNMTMPTRKLIALFLCFFAAACSTGPRLEVSAGQSFKISDSPETATTALRVEDHRKNVLTVSSRQALDLTVGDADIYPKPPDALRNELVYFRTLFNRNGETARTLAGKTIELEEFRLTISAADVSQPRNGQSPASPPGVAMVDAGARSLAQTIGGGSDITVEIAFTVEGRRTTGKGQFRTTANPGHSSTIQAFRRALAAALTNLAATEK